MDKNAPRGTEYHKLSEIERFIIHLKMAGLRSGGRIDGYITNPESVAAIIDCLRLGLIQMYDAVYTSEKIVYNFKNQRT